MPKVVFKKMELNDNIDIVKWTFKETDETLPVYENTIQYYPELSKVDRNKLSNEEIDKIVSDVVVDYYDKNKELIDESIKKYKNIWEEYNDEYFDILCKYLNVDVNKVSEEFICEVGFIPVSPRYLNLNIFSTTVGIDNKNIIEIIAHEILHFIWYMKWMELYPLCQKEEYECPNLVWKYSEMVVDFILNSKEINKVFDNKFLANAYDYFYDLEENGELVMKHLEDIYKEEISIEEKIKKGYLYLQGLKNI